MSSGTGQLGRSLLDVLATAPEATPPRSPWDFSRKPRRLTVSRSRAAAGEWTTVELAERVGASERGVRRSLDRLHRLGQVAKRVDAVGPTGRALWSLHRDPP